MSLYFTCRFARCRFCLSPFGNALSPSPPLPLSPSPFLFTGSMQIPSAPLRRRGAARNSLFSEHLPFGCYGGACVCLLVGKTACLFIIVNQARAMEASRACVAFRAKTHVCDDPSPPSPISTLGYKGKAGTLSFSARLEHVGRRIADGA